MKLVLTFFLIAMSIQTLYAQKGIVKKEIKKPMSLYLTQSDPVYIAIKARVINDLAQSFKSADTANEKNKSISKKLKTLPEERQQYYQDLFIQSLQDYAMQVHLDFEMFMLFYTDLMKKDQKTLNELDFRVQKIDGNKCVAELWEDGLVANSEAKAVAWAKEILKHHPGDEKETIKEVKATYAKARKDMLSGKQQRYTKLIAYLYTKEKDGSVLFHDPGQAMLNVKEADIH